MRYLIYDTFILDTETNGCIPMDNDNEAFQKFKTAPENDKQYFDTLERKRAAAVLRLKQEAETAILAIMPEVQQRNNLAFSIAVLYSKLKGDTIDPATQTQFEALERTWGAIKAIRAKSNAAEKLAMISITPEIITLNTQEG